MAELAILAAAVPVVAWGVLLCFRHGFWCMDQRLEGPAQDPSRWPSVAAIVPARNEAETVERCLRALAAQTYEGSFQIVLVNDSSTDATAEIARKVAAECAATVPVHVLDAPPLQAGWAGKMWALKEGLSFVERLEDAPDYVWFTDSDVIHWPAELARLAGHAENNAFSLVSLMVRLACASRWERLLVPAFIFFFQMLYPFRAVNDGNSRVAGAAGGCMLIKLETLRSVGGIEAVKDRLIDDCALAETIKRGGHRIWLGLADDSYSLRRYETLGDFWQMVTRSAFVQLRYSTFLLLLSVAGMSLVFLAPPAMVLLYPLHESVAMLIPGAVAWAAMTASYIPCLRYHGMTPVHALMLPVASGLYTAMTVHSALKHWFGTGSHWKDRAYHPK